MDERSGGIRLLAVVLLIAAIAGAWLWLRRPAVTEAISTGVDPFVPTAAQWQRRTGAIGEAQRVRDLANARQQPDRDR